MEAYRDLLALTLGVALVLRWEWLRRRRDRRQKILKNLRQILGAGVD